MPDQPCLRVHNGESISNAAVPLSSPTGWWDAVARAVEAGGRIAALFAQPAARSPSLLTAIVARDADAAVEVFAAPVDGEYTALTSVHPQAHWFERDIWERRGIVPVGHPWLKPVRFSRQAAGRAFAADAPTPATCGVTDFFRMAGVVCLGTCARTSLSGSIGLRRFPCRPGILGMSLRGPS